MSIKDLYELFLGNPKICTDSRSVEKGSLFFALKGDTFNGNNFAFQAIEQGAAFAIIDENPAVQDNRLILVENVLNALQDLAHYHRTQLGIPVLAITGTNGKTTTKELTTAVLSKKYKVVATKGNLNNHIGVPLTLLSMDQSTQIGIVEMGANHQGEIAELSRIASPDFGLITNVGKAHLEGFGSFEGVKKTKAELYRFVEMNHGKVFINTSNENLCSMIGTNYESINYRVSKEGVGLEGELLQSSPHLVFQVKFPKGWLYIKTNLAGGYNLENALAAVCVGNYFGVDPLEIKGAIEAYIPSNNRSQFLKSQRNQVIMDAYNANPSSMEAALENFKTFVQKPKGVILGDMFELGETAADEHQKIVDKLEQMDIDLILLTGKEFSKCKISSQMHSFENNNQLIKYLESFKPENFLFLIKGSRGMKLETIIGKL